MEIKSKLKERLLAIPINHKAYRETFRLADDLDVEVKDLEPLLEELCNANILTKKIEYICSTCRNTTILNNESLKEIIEEDDCFECEECSSLVNTNKDKTGYIYYDVKDKQGLMQWS